MTTFDIARPASGSKLLPRVIVTGALMLFGVWGISYSRNFFTLEKPPAPLNKPLEDLAKKFGPYEQVGTDRQLDAEVIESLGTKDYLLRQYRDTSKKPEELGAFISLNLNFYASGSATPHVPDICWAGNGLVRVSDEMFEVDNVPHKNHTISPKLRMRQLAFRPQVARNSLLPDVDENTDNNLINVAYCFQLNNQYVSTSAEVTKDFWNPKATFAYHAKIELTISTANGVPYPCDPVVAKPIFAKFLQSALPEIEDCLPDSEHLKELADQRKVGKVK